jgi:hypothetical protein
MFGRVFHPLLAAAVAVLLFCIRAFGHSLTQVGRWLRTCCITSPNFIHWDLLYSLLGFFALNIDVGADLWSVMFAGRCQRRRPPACIFGLCLVPGYLLGT